jgi:hypothetical protein
MSGGSFHYLCWKSAEDLLSGHANDQLEKMHDDLLARGFTDAADLTDSILRCILDAHEAVQQQARELAAVWQAVEWHTSGDWGPEQVDRAIEQFRKYKASR